MHDLKKLNVNLLTTKGWYLCCHKYRLTNLNVYSNNYSLESSFVFRGVATICF